MNSKPALSQRASFNCLLIFLTAILGGCGGGGGGGGTMMTQVDASVLFPSNGMNFEDDTIIVHGIGSAGADAVTVNGQSATSTDGFATWQSTLSLVPGQNDIDVRAMAGGQVVASELVSVTRYPEVAEIATASDLVGTKVLVADGIRPQVVLFDTQNGSRRGFNMPAGYDVSKLRRVIYDAGRNRGMVLAEDLFQIDITMGTVQTIPLVGPFVFGGVELCHDPVLDRYLVLLPPGSQLNDQSNVVAYDPQTTTFSTYSGDPASPLPEDTNLVSMDRDPITGRLFAYADGNTFFEIHTDGSRTIVGPPGSNQSSAFYSNSKVLVSSGAEFIFRAGERLDLNSGTISPLQENPANAGIQAVPLRGRDDSGRFLVTGFRLPTQIHRWDPMDNSYSQRLALGNSEADNLRSSSLDIVLGLGLAFDDNGGMILSPVSEFFQINAKTGHANSIYDPNNFNGQTPYFGNPPIYDASRDAFLFVQRNQTGYEVQALAADGSSVTALTLLSGSSRYLVALAPDPTNGLVYSLNADALTPNSMIRVDSHDATGNMVGSQMTQVPGQSLWGRGTYDATRNRIYLLPPSDYLFSSGVTDFDLIAIDPTTGVSFTVSMDGANGIDSTDVAIGLDLHPRTGEILFADQARLVAVDPDSGARRVVSDFGARYGDCRSGGFCVDPRSSVAYLAVFTPRLGLMAIDLENGATSFLKR